MLKAIGQLDRVLRGELTRTESLREGTVAIALGGMIPVLAVLGVINGVCIGFYALSNRGAEAWMQVVAAAVKVPALFFLTLLVTFPSLYVFNAIVGCGLRMGPMLRLIVAALGVTMALLASFGPIVAFFSFSTANYSFMVLVNVVVYAAAGSMGLLFLLRTLQRLASAILHDEILAGNRAVPPAAAGGDGDEDDDAEARLEASPLDPSDAGVLGPHVRAVFRIWVVVFGLVGAQMAWVLRPFIGDPGTDFTWFRPRSSSFFESVWQHIVNLF